MQRFILLGHSLGGYLATSYAMRYPERVRHLVLVDPWGFVEPPSEEEVRQRVTGFWRLTWHVMSYMRPFTAVRAAGPWGEGREEPRHSCRAQQKFSWGKNLISK